MKQSSLPSWPQPSKELLAMAEAHFVGNMAWRRLFYKICVVKVAIQIGVSDMSANAYVGDANTRMSKSFKHRIHEVDAIKHELFFSYLDALRADIKAFSLAQQLKTQTLILRGVDQLVEARRFESEGFSIYDVRDYFIEEYRAEGVELQRDDFIRTDGARILMRRYLEGGSLPIQQRWRSGIRQAVLKSNPPRLVYGVTNDHLADLALATGGVAVRYEQWGAQGRETTNGFSRNHTPPEELAAYFRAVCEASVRMGYAT